MRALTLKEVPDIGMEHSGKKEARKGSIARALTLKNAAGVLGIRLQAVAQLEVGWAGPGSGAGLSQASLGARPEAVRGLRQCAA